jgi:hypothetical protein
MEYVRRLPEMSGSAGKTPALPDSQTDIYLFQGTEESRERQVQMSGPASRLPEIARAELVLA